jgi:hypothetical protein
MLYLTYYLASALHPDRLWGPPSLLSNGYRGVLSPGVKRGRGVTLTTHPHLVPRLRMSRMMEAARTSETLVNFYQTTRRYNPEDSHLRTHRRENVKSYLDKWAD